MEMPTSCQSFPNVVTTTGSLVFDASTGFTKYGGGGRFDGSNDFIDLSNIVGSDLDLVKADAFSIGCWIKAPTMSTLPSILTKATGFANEAGYKFYTGSTGRLAFKLSDGTGSLAISVSTPEVDDDVWNSVFATYDGSGNQNGMKLYINKTLEITGGSATISGDITNTETTTIGADSGGTSKLDASLAWLVIIKEELTQSWINAYHDNGHLDFSGGNLIFFVPFVGDAEVFSEATSNYCVSS